MERKERNNEANKSEYTEKLVHLGKVTKVVKGGKNMRWNALVVVGDENGHVGAGMGKAAEVPDAVRKAVAAAKKNMITVPMVGTTIPHEIIGRCYRGRRGACRCRARGHQGYQNEVSEIQQPRQRRYGYDGSSSQSRYR